MTLDELNRLTGEQAQAEFLKCCGSMHWARRMSDARPFGDLGQLMKEADQVWWSLTEEDWLEAFRAHPKIGEKKATTAQSDTAQKWSAQEQSKTAGAGTDVMSALAAGNREYERRFGFIYIVCASGKTAAEMLAILNQRIGNTTADELRIAAEEQRKITQLRLAKLLEGPAA